MDRARGEPEPAHELGLVPFPAPATLLKQLQDENARLKTLVAERRLGDRHETTNRRN